MDGNFIVNAAFYRRQPPSPRQCTACAAAELIARIGVFRIGVKRLLALLRREACLLFVRVLPLPLDFLRQTTRLPVDSVDDFGVLVLEPCVPRCDFDRDILLKQVYEDLSLLVGDLGVLSCVGHKITLA